MLSCLTIENLGLIDKHTFVFKKGFTSITGETGSGKTSLIEALKLALGKKSDFDFIKKGEKKAFIQACFELNPDHPIYPLLLEKGFLIEKGELLIISRHLSLCGKSKAFLNDQPISISLLTALSCYLCDFIDQESLFETKKQEEFLQLLDSTGSYSSLLQDYKNTYHIYVQLQKQIKQLQKHAEGKEFKQSLIEDEIKELKEALMSFEEEEALFETYKKAQAMQGQVHIFESYAKTLNEVILPHLRKMKTDKVWTHEQKDLFESSYIHLCEISNRIEDSIQEGSFNPQELQKMEDKLKLIHSLKRKYNVEIKEFDHILETKIKELDFLFSLDEELEKAIAMLNITSVDTFNLANKLADKRQAWAKELEKHLIANLKPLNMPYVELAFTFHEAPLSESGHQVVDLLLKANAASNMVAVHQGASGGELARINFCFFLETSKLQAAPTYIFDEIDASVGGVTSALMGQKLQELACDKQIFCITHFPQMAQKATNHLVFEKKQNENKTSIAIHYSTNGPIESEIERMIGVKG